MKKKIYRERCTNWTRYQAKRAPTCGCKVCNEKWNHKKFYENKECIEFKIVNGEWERCKNRPVRRTVECSIGYENDKTFYMCDECWRDRGR